MRCRVNTTSIIAASLIEPSIASVSTSLVFSVCRFNTTLYFTLRTTLQS